MDRSVNTRFDEGKYEEGVRDGFKAGLLTAPPLTFQQASHVGEVPANFPSIDLLIRAAPHHTYKQTHLIIITIMPSHTLLSLSPSLPPFLPPSLLPFLSLFLPFPFDLTPTRH